MSLDQIRHVRASAITGGEIACQVAGDLSTRDAREVAGVGGIEDNSLDRPCAGSARVVLNLDPEVFRVRAGDCPDVADVTGIVGVFGPNPPREGFRNQFDTWKIGTRWRICRNRIINPQERAGPLVPRCEDDWVCARHLGSSGEQQEANDN